MPISFDQALQSLHDNAIMQDTDSMIEINNKRQFIVPPDFDTVIAYEGDANSQIITFKCVRYADGHDLSKCVEKTLRWKNLSSKIEGNFGFDASKMTVEEEYMFLRWEVPLDACTQAGIIEIALKCYDMTDNALTFSWNTASFSGLSVGKSMDSVDLFPTKDQLLVIDKESRNIVAPAGYNNIICNYGDVGVSNVFFLINRHLGRYNEFDLLDENMEATIYVKIGGEKIKERITVIEPYSTEIAGPVNGGLVLLTWEVPAEITAGDFGAAKLDVSLEFVIKEKEVIKRRWLSNVYSKLEIAESIVLIEIDDSGKTAAETAVYKLIDKYFDVHELVWDSNEE